MTHIGENVGKLEPMYTIDGNANWYSCCRKQYGATHFWVFIQKY